MIARGVAAILPARRDNAVVQYPFESSGLSLCLTTCCWIARIALLPVPLAPTHCLHHLLRMLPNPHPIDMLLFLYTYASSLYHLFCCLHRCIPHHPLHHLIINTIYIHLGNRISLSHTSRPPRWPIPPDFPETPPVASHPTPARALRTFPAHDPLCLPLRSSFLVMMPLRSLSRLRSLRSGAWPSGSEGRKGEVDSPVPSYLFSLTTLRIDDFS